MMPRPAPRYIRRLVFLAVYIGLTALFWHAYQIRYGRHADCFNEHGRCYVPGEGVLTAGGAIWGLVAFIFACLAVAAVLRLVITLIRNR